MGNQNKKLVQSTFTKLCPLAADYWQVFQLFRNMECRMIENMINDCTPSCILCCSAVPVFIKRIIRFHLIVIFSRMLLFIVSDPCVIHIDSLRGNRVNSKLWFATMAIVLLISKVMSSITCNNKDKSFSHAPLNSGMTLFT